MNYINRLLGATGVFPLVSSLSLYSLLTYPSIRTRSWLVLTKVSRDLFGVAFVIASAGLSIPLIYRILNSSLRSYDCRRAIMSIIRRFSFVVLSLTKHSYNEYESVQTIVGMAGRPSCSVIIFSVEPMAKVMSMPATIP